MELNRTTERVKVNMLDSVCFSNGTFIAVSEAKIPVIDLAVMRGYGVFDSLRTYGGKPFRIENHLVRLERSAELIGLSIPWSKSEISEVILETLRRNNYPEAGVRIIVTGGETEDFFTPTGKPGLIVLVTPLQLYPKIYYSQGVKVATTELERYLPEAKTINYTSGKVAMSRAKVVDPDIIEVLCIDRNQRITEGIASNVFMFFGDALVTPESNILLGITRDVVLELADAMFKIELRNVFKSELIKADEIFITGSAKEIMPVTSVDGKTLCNGRCGPNTLRLMEKFQEMTRQFLADDTKNPSK